MTAEFAAALKGDPYDTAYRVVKGEEVRWIKSKAREMNHLGRVRLVGLCEDITSRKDAEEALRTSSERLHLALTTGHIASWDWNLKTDKVVWHESEWVYGRSGEELDTPHKCFSWIYPEDASSVQDALKPALQEEAEYRCEFRILWPDGSLHWCVARGRSFDHDATGKPSRMIGVNLDVTERKQSEAALMQNEKLAAMGRLSSSIAHEINNPLESVTNLLYLIKSSTDLQAIQEWTDTAERELRRVSLITNQTLRFHRQATGPSPFYCHDLIGDSLSIYQGRIVNSRIQVDKRKRAEQSVLCLGGEIRQVLSNLIGNAIDAMPLGGRLVLRSREATHWKTGEKGLVITVADTWIGMSAATQRKIFEPFFTTKGIGGTGLGLWISAEIIHRHRGSLRVRSSQSAQHSGTICALFLPFEAARLERALVA